MVMCSNHVCECDYSVLAELDLFLEFTGFPAAIPSIFKAVTWFAEHHECKITSRLQTVSPATNKIGRFMDFE